MCDCLTQTKPVILLFQVLAISLHKEVHVSNLFPSANTCSNHMQKFTATLNHLSRSIFLLGPSWASVTAGLLFKPDNICGGSKICKSISRVMLMTRIMSVFSKRVLSIFYNIPCSCLYEAILKMQLKKQRGNVCC
jgi:hypothetical protein